VVYEKEWMGSVKEAGTFGRWNGVAFEDGKEARSVFNCVLKRFHGQLQKESECVCVCVRV
jgi:hypothetical protein